MLPFMPPRTLPESSSLIAATLLQSSFDPVERRHG
jgi:hypothetical protein